MKNLVKKTIRFMIERAVWAKLSEGKAEEKNFPKGFKTAKIELSTVTITYEAE